MEVHNHNLEEKFRRMKDEVRYEEYMTEDAEYLFVAYGLSARICQKAVEIAREKGIHVGLLRPITLYPFPEKRLNELADSLQMMISVELNSGQMVEDVRLAVNGKVPVEFFGRLGGMMPTPESIVQYLETQIQLCHVN